MNLVNAIAKVRFSSAKPQSVQLHNSEALLAELVCMEPGQQLKVATGEWTYYVVTGTAAFIANGDSSVVPAGQFASFAPGESHVVANETEQRLVCLAVGSGC